VFRLIAAAWTLCLWFIVGGLLAGSFVDAEIDTILWWDILGACRLRSLLLSIR
jgi:hypothetical protein